MANAAFTARCVAAGLLWMIIQSVQADDVKRYVVEGSRAAGLSACVEPTELMRRQHMTFIKHQRISTVHEGVRTGKYSLSGCVACHISYDAQQNARPINQPDQFCGACHAYAAVNLNCFDCHASVPNAGTPLTATAIAAHQKAGVTERIQSQTAAGEGH